MILQSQQICWIQTLRREIPCPNSSSSSKSDFTWRKIRGTIPRDAQGEKGEQENDKIGLSMKFSSEIHSFKKQKI